MTIITVILLCPKFVSLMTITKLLDPSLSVLIPHLQGCSAAYVATGVFGVELWHFYVYPGWSFAYVLKYLLIVAFFGGIPTSLWNIYDYYSKPK